MNPYVSLPDGPMLQGRQDFVLDACSGKRVLHLGCVDSGLTLERFLRGELLHQRLSKVASELWGLDIDAAGIDFLHRQGFDRLLIADISRSEDIVQFLRAQNFDVVLATEVLEHLANPVDFLTAVRRLMTPAHTQFIVTVPNAFRVATLLWMWRGVEYVHPDHNYWFSYATITALLNKSGFRIGQVYPYTFQPAHFLPRKLARQPGSGMTQASRESSTAGKPDSGFRTYARLLASYYRGLPERVLASLLYSRTPFWGDGLLVVATVDDHARLA